MAADVTRLRVGAASTNTLPFGLKKPPDDCVVVAFKVAAASPEETEAIWRVLNAALRDVLVPGNKTIMLTPLPEGCEMDVTDVQKIADRVAPVVCRMLGVPGPRQEVAGV